MEGGGEGGDGSIILASLARAKMPTIYLGLHVHVRGPTTECTQHGAAVPPPQGPQCALALRAVVPGEMLATEAYSGRRRRGAGNVEVQAMP